MNELRYTTTDDRYKLEKAHTDDAGYDLHAAQDYTIKPGEQKMVDTMYCTAIPRGWFGRVEDRSGYAKRRIRAHGRIIDNIYRGTIKVILENDSQDILFINYGDRIAQLVLYQQFDGETKKEATLDDTERGASGFGSTGK